MKSEFCEEEKGIIQTTVIMIQRIGKNANLVRTTITEVPTGYEKGKTLDMTPAIVFDRADAFQDEGIRAMADTLAEYIKRVLDK